MSRDLPSDDVAHIMDAVAGLTEQTEALVREQRTANLIAYAKVALSKNDAARALKAARSNLEILGVTNE